MKKILSLVIVLILISGLTACNAATEKSDKITVAVSIAPQSTFVERVCGDKMKIVTMIPAGASAESYELTPKEITAFADSELYFSIGVPAEESGILPNVSKSTKVIYLASTVNQAYPDLESHGERDPHIWLSPKRVKIMVKTIAEELSAIDSENSEFYNKNADSYIKELEQLDTEIKKIFNNKKEKAFFVFHPAFGYFADDYSLEMYALEEHGHEATAKDLTELARLAKEKGVKVIFCQEEASKKQAQTFAAEIGGKVQILKPLAADYTENLKQMATLIGKAVK